MIRKPYEMNFAEFAEAIQPAWATCLGPSKSLMSGPTWLTSVWNSADKLGFYHVYWHNDQLKNELPPEAHEYEFDEISLLPITEQLGLNPKREKDNIQASMLLAVRNAWVSAIQYHYRQTAPSISDVGLSNTAASEYVLLTSGLWHPWIEKQVHHYLIKLESNKFGQMSKTDFEEELSEVRNSLEEQEKQIRAAEEYRLECLQAQIEEDKQRVHYWIDSFQNEAFQVEGCSINSDVRSAQQDINIAKQKIAVLQKLIEKQMTHIQRAERIIRKIKRHEAAVRKSQEIGRPRKSPERQAVAVKFVSQWVQSLMSELEVKNCAQLETFIKGSNQRNWRRWLNGKCVPNRGDLSDLLSADIWQGKYKGNTHGIE